ncbi:RNA polymerase-binding protein RbpA [Leucobacter salsicius]|uniref:RNA polymerase-binding protein RbpA n=1 Tax=Leucobacter salsicius TaxID=664638 RepID=UPI000347C0E0|nr:RNA polymerase-binding protein RbpA [Leucobacter salsicius]
MAGSNAIRGARVGSGPMGEQDHGARAERTQISYWDALGNETVRYFAADVAVEDIPEQIDSPTSGLPAGRDQANPPQVLKNEPFKTHLAYVKERRTEEEAVELLDAALDKLRARRGTARSKA